MDPTLVLALIRASPQLIDDLIKLLQAYQAFMVKVKAVTGGAIS
jgi:hypothetical protein